MKNQYKLLSCLILLFTMISVFPLKTVGLSINGNDNDLERYTATEGESWMKKIVNDTPLARLSIPGTHDTMAYKGSWGANAGILNPVQRFTKTQNWDLRTQLNNGVRFVDIRIDVDMSIHHGIVDLESSLDGDVLPTIRAFLAANPDEIVFARMKSENGDNPTQFERNIAPILEANKDLFAKVRPGSRVRDARGKIVVFDNTGSSRSFFNRGLAYALWNSSYLDKQDNYDNPSRANKKNYIRDKFTASMKAPLTSQTMYVNHISATGKIPFGSTPRDFANDLNPWTVNYINSLTHPSQLGIVIFDFIGTSELNAVMSSNSAYLASTWGDVRWKFESSTGELTFLTSGTLGTYDSSPWNRIDQRKVDKSAIKKIIFTSAVSVPSNSMFLFSVALNGKSVGGLENLKEFVGFSHVQTSTVTNMSFMFALMGNVKGFNLANFNTSKVTTMQGMFLSAKVPEITLQNLDTSNVMNMSDMFTSMPNLVKLDLSSFKTSKVTNMNRMFANSNKLATLNMSYFDMSRVQNKAEMFLNDTNLKELVINTTFTHASNVYSLPTISKKTNYTGNWMTKEGQNVGSTSQFLANLTKTGTGTYIWEETVDYDVVPAFIINR